MTTPLLMTEIEAAAYVGVSRWTLAKWRKAGRVPVVKPDPAKERVYYRTADLDEYVARMAAVAS